MPSRKPGLYVVVDGGGQFPWYDTLRPAAARPKTSCDRPGSGRWTTPEYDAGPTEVLARLYELLAGSGTARRPAAEHRPAYQVLLFR